MNRDFLINEILHGEEVTVEDWIKANAQTELDAIYREAESIRAAETARLDGEKRRQTVLTRLLTLDSEAERLNADLLALREEREAMIRGFEEKEATINEAMRQTRLKFSDAFRFFNNGAAYSSYSPQTFKTVDWLREQGAKINALAL